MTRETAVLEEPAGGLGPAVTSDFAEAVGLDELVARASGRTAGDGEDRTALASQSAPAPTPPPAPAVELDPRLLEKTLVMMDAMISAFAGIERETEDELAPIAGALQPLAEHYAGQTPGVTTLWIVASLAIGGYALTKWQKYRAAHPKSSKRTAAMSGADGRPVDLAEVATPPEDRIHV